MEVLMVVLHLGLLMERVENENTFEKYNKH